MSELIKTGLSKEELNEIVEFISILLKLTKEERIIILSNANAFIALENLKRVNK